MLNISKILVIVYFYQQKGGWLRKKHSFHHFFNWNLNNNHPFIINIQNLGIKKIRKHFTASKLITIDYQLYCKNHWQILLKNWTQNKFSKHGLTYAARPHLIKTGKKSSYMSFKSKFF